MHCKPAGQTPGGLPHKECWFFFLTSSGLSKARPAGFFSLPNLSGKTCGTFIHRRSQFAIAIYTPANNGEAVFPELARTNIDPKASRQVSCAVFLGGGKQCLVIIYKFGAALLIDGV